MKSDLFVVLVMCAPPLTMVAQSPPPQVPLWPNGAPGFEDRRDEPERVQDYWVRNMANRSDLVSLKHWPQWRADWLADNYILDPTQREAELRRKKDLAAQRRQRREEQF